jgi:hypothetical protein
LIWHEPVRAWIELAATERVQGLPGHDPEMELFSAALHDRFVAAAIAGLAQIKHLSASIQ